METLRFERDSAVQVDTLPPLLRLTSQDGYLHELRGALRELSDNLDALERLLDAAPPPTARDSASHAPATRALVSRDRLFRDRLTFA